MRRYKSPVSGLKSGVASGLGPLRNSSQIITADTAPVLAALDDADTPADGFTSGTYSSTAGTISSETAVYLVDGAPQAGSFDLTAGEMVRVREDVVDSAANERSFYTTTQVVQPSVALSNSAVPTIDQAIIGEVSTATTGTWAGSAARTYSYQWKVGGVDVGTDSNTYTPQPADDGLDLTVTVTADDGFTQVPATSAATTVSEAVPILTTPTAAADGQNGVKTLSVITDTGDGTLVASTYPAADTPTAPAVELGTGAVITDSKTVTVTGLQTFPAGTGLDPITPYKTWYVHRSAAGQLSEAVASATFYTDPGVYAAAGVADIEVNDGLDNPTVVVTVGGVEVFNGPVALLNLQADAYALVDPAIGVVGGGDPATDSTLEDLDEDVWTFDPAINPTPTPTLQWDSDGSPVSGATASTYAIQAGQIDTDMTLDKTLLGVTTSSNAIVIPAALSLQDTARSTLVALDSDAALRTITEAVSQGRLWQDTGGTTAATADGHTVRKIDMMSGISLVAAGPGDATLRLANGLYYLEFTTTARTYFDYTNSSGTNTSLYAAVAGYFDGNSITSGQRGYIFCFGDSGSISITNDDYIGMSVKYGNKGARRNATELTRAWISTSEVSHMETTTNYVEFGCESTGNQTSAPTLSTPLDFNTIRLGCDTISTSGPAMAMSIYGLCWCRAQLDASARSDVIAALGEHNDYT